MKMYSRLKQCKQCLVPSTRTPALGPPEGVLKRAGPHTDAAARLAPDPAHMVGRRDAAV